jgi:exodeoxyribonuclease VII small subunit
MAEATFEAQMEELEQLVNRLERGELPLEEALAAFGTGMKLVSACEAKLAQAELQVEEIMDAYGNTAPLEVDDAR